MSGKVEYPNLRSRILLRSVFKHQFVIPEEPPRSAVRFLNWYEKRIMKVDTSGIKIDRPIFMIALPRAGTRQKRYKRFQFLGSYSFVKEYVGDSEGVKKL